MYYVIKCLSAILVSLGFAIVFGVRPCRLPWVCLGGLIAIGAYLPFVFLGEFVANAVATFVVTLYCETAARIGKAPVVSYLTPAVIVLAPGALLYKTIYGCIVGDYAAAGAYGTQTLQVCIGIAAGIIVASLLASVIFRFVFRPKGEHGENNRIFHRS